MGSHTRLLLGVPKEISKPVDLYAYQCPHMIATLAHYSQNYHILKSSL